ASWNTVRNLIADIVQIPSLEACQNVCLQNEQCAAVAYSSVSTCALLGGDSGRAFTCPASASLYLRDPACPRDCPNPPYLE
ncbi:hypothetical protein PMAYCL1PPCAC_22111, partial [Pristionchus mayeri]